MALGAKKKKSSGGEGKKESKFVTVFQILEGKPRDGEKEGQAYAKASDFKGRLIWQEFGGSDGKDEDDSKFYEIKSAFIGTPHESAPEFVLQTIVVNLLNPKAAELLDS